MPSELDSVSVGVCCVCWGEGEGGGGEVGRGEYVLCYIYNICKNTSNKSEHKRMKSSSNVVFFFSKDYCNSIQ